MARTTIGAEQVARAEPDGDTPLLATSTTLAINKTLYRKLPCDPVKDFTPTARPAGVPFALIVTLLSFDHAIDAAPLQIATRSRGLLNVLDIGRPEAVRFYGCRLVRSRPHQPVVWRGDRLPADPLALIVRPRHANEEAEIGQTGSGVWNNQQK